MVDDDSTTAKDRRYPKALGYRGNLGGSWRRLWTKRDPANVRSQSSGLPTTWGFALATPFQPVFIQTQDLQPAVDWGNSDQCMNWPPQDRHRYVRQCLEGLLPQLNPSRPFPRNQPELYQWEVSENLRRRCHPNPHRSKPIFRHFRSLPLRLPSEAPFEIEQVVPGSHGPKTDARPRGPVDRYAFNQI